MVNPDQNNQGSHQPSYTIRLRAASPGTVSVLNAVFQLAPEKSVVGAPGKQPGDLLLRERTDGGHTLLVSLGTAEKCSPEMVRRAGGALGKWLMDNEITQLQLDLDSLKPCLVEGAAAALCEGLKLGAYKFNRYKQNGTDAPVVEVLLNGSEASEINNWAEWVEAVTNAVILARDISHEPANSINPVTLADRAREIAVQCGLTCTVLDEQQLAELGAGAILAVGQGSPTPPRLIILEYAGQGEPDEQPVVLVGKAITFDTGGYSLKDTAGIVGMKYDKCGGVNVLAVMQAAAALKLKTPLVGIIGAAENMISSKAYRPDDILTTLNGKTVEIVSTDAEGRLVLADALAYAQNNYQPRALIDLATLTGGVVVALGRVRAGMLANNDVLAQQLFSAGEKTHERLWRLPLDEDYSKNMKGDDADLKNSGGREGHCILGGAFIQEFVSPAIPWAHLDIAGVAETPKDLPYAPKGATGFGIRLLIEYLRNL
jgi:leucyl aminopeptidase